MANIRLFTKPGCPHCARAKEWLDQQDCPVETLDITGSVEVLREWRELSGGAGVPVLAHGRDLVIGFSQDRYAQLLASCRHTSAVETSSADLP
jgi:glutaredoxin